MQEIWQLFFWTALWGIKLWHAGPIHTLALARNAYLKNNMHFELAHIEQTEQIYQKPEYTSCNPESDSSEIFNIDAINSWSHSPYTAAINPGRGIEENINYGREPQYTGIGRKIDPRRSDPRRTVRYACATPPCLDSQYETVDITLLETGISIVPQFH